MKMSQCYMPTLKESPREAEIISHQLLLRAGMIRKMASGVYTFLPFGLNVLRKIESIIREEMNATGAQEVLMPMVTSAALWKKSGRWEQYGKELLRFKDRHDNEFCLGPTHEEVIAYLVKDEIKSYKQLPTTLYQIQTKFRDEIRPRFGLMRSREFLMKDAYSFHLSDACLDETYHAMSHAYHRIFQRCGLSVKCVNADNGNMGGSGSSEFMVTAETGEDEIQECPNCQFAANTELVSHQTCPACGHSLHTIRGIEVGHIFKLGNKYTQSLNMNVPNASGTLSPVTMGCYGIGVGRTLSAAIEQHHDDKGIKWPTPIAPFLAVIIISNPKDTSLLSDGNRIYQELMSQNIDVILDDRYDRIGTKFKDADLIGFPFQLVMGKSWISNQKFEFKNRMTSDTQFLTLSEVINVISNP